MGSSLRAHRNRIARQRRRRSSGTATQPGQPAGPPGAAPWSRPARRARPGGIRRRRGRAVAAAAAALVVLVVASSQLAIPSLITGKLRAQLQKIATVRSVSVSGFPAIEALWGRLDSVQVHLGRVGGQRLAGGGPASAGPKTSLARTAARVTDASLQADQVVMQHPVAQDLHLDKTGQRLRLSVFIDPAAITPVLARSLHLPAGSSVQLTAVRSDLVLLIGIPRLGGTVRLRILAEDGTLAGQLQPTAAMAAKLGLPPGMSPPPQPLLHTKAVTISQFAATWRGGRLRLTTAGQLTG